MRRLGRILSVLFLALGVSELSAFAQSTNFMPSNEFIWPTTFRIGDQEKDGKKGKSDQKNAAQDDAKGTDAEPSWYSVHGQGTIVSQGNGRFRSPYPPASGPIPPRSGSRCRVPIFRRS